MAENIVFFCNCQSRKDTAEWTKTTKLLEQFDDFHKVTISDLCGVCALDSKKLADMINHAGKVVMIACHPRSVRLLLNQAGIHHPDKIRFFNLLEDNTDELLQIIKDYRFSDHDNSYENDLVADLSWPAWYPLIDDVRCNACGQCAEFCLFGVYQKINGKVEIVNPKACKNNCPACARICPNVAIVFPKYAQRGAIQGSDSVNETLEMQRLMQDTDELLGSDIYHALEKRKMKRRSVIRDDAMQQAILERDEALSKTGTK
ncbi:MAG: hypothetical protein WCP32_13730 [Bacteroidota bacterium]